MAINIPSNEYWGRKYGMYVNLAPKGSKTVWGNVFNIPRGSQTGRAGTVKKKK